MGISQWRGYINQKALGLESRGLLVTMLTFVCSAKEQRLPGSLVEALLIGKNFTQTLRK